MSEIANEIWSRTYAVNLSDWRLQKDAEANYSYTFCIIDRNSKVFAQLAVYLVSTIVMVSFILSRQVNVEDF